MGKYKDFRLRLNLQEFGGTNETPAQQDGSTKQDDPAQTTPPVTKEGGESETAQSKDDAGEGKTFTQTELTAVAAKEARKAREKVFKDLGIDGKDIDKAKEDFKSYQEYLDSQKTDAELAIDRAKTLETELNTYKTQVEERDAQLEAMKADVDPESINDVVVLARNLVNDETDMSEAIKQVVTKYPQFKRVTEAPVVEETATKKPKFSSGEHDAGKTPTVNEQWLEAFKLN